jgi:hypothetical protein
MQSGSPERDLVGLPRRRLAEGAVAFTEHPLLNAAERTFSRERPECRAAGGSLRRYGRDVICRERCGGRVGGAP